jgi:hypothetical protein
MIDTGETTSFLEHPCGGRAVVFLIPLSLRISWKEKYQITQFWKKISAVSKVMNETMVKQ